MDAIGRKRWAIAEGFIPPYSMEGADRALISHEAACILNANVDREPIGAFRIDVPARRTLHLRFNDLNDPEPIPVGTDYASVIESNVPIVVQHTRLDSRHSEISLLSTIAYSAG
jgi:hypothetical protein